MAAMSKDFTTKKSTYLLNLLRYCKLNAIRDKFGVLFDNVPDLFLLQVFELVLFEEQADLSTTAKRLVDGIRGYGEGTGDRRVDAKSFADDGIHYRELVSPLSIPFKEQADLGTTTKRLVDGITGYSEGVGLRTLHMMPWIGRWTQRVSRMMASITGSWRSSL
jgi:hypothetical protein